MHLLGRSNWWIPRWLDKVLPRLHVEGSGETAPEAVDPPEASHERPLEPTGA
jgi:RND superfamily putative drug exporter